MAPRRFMEPIHVPPRPSGRPRKVAPGVQEGCSVAECGGDRRVAVEPVTPRLLDLPATATYLGVSEWTVRDLEHTGTLKRIRIPLANHGELRKLLFDKTDLDKLIEEWKGT